MRSSSDENSRRRWPRKTKKLVVDANILFAALIINNKTSELIFSDRLELIAPELLFEEFKKYKSMLLEKTKRTKQECITTYEILKRNIHIITKKELQAHLREAENISPDKGDIQFFAAALLLNIPIWSNDKKLREQKVVEIISTDELNKALDKRT